MEGSFDSFLAHFIGRHPEWFSDVRGREWGGAGSEERFQEAMNRVPSAAPAASDALEAPVAKEAGQDEVRGDSAGVEVLDLPLVSDGVLDGGEWEMAEEVRDENEEKDAVLDAVWDGHGDDEEDGEGAGEEGEREAEAEVLSE